MLKKGLVYPACAGIDPAPAAILFAVTGLPRMRGDRPAGAITAEKIAAFTPHARGSTVWHIRMCRLARVYPACAGIDRG